jgi:hypothetical protein
MALMRIREAGEDKEKFAEPKISKRVLRRITDDNERRHARGMAAQAAIMQSLADERDCIDHKYRKQVQITYCVGVLSLVMGGILGWLMH